MTTLKEAESLYELYRAVSCIMDHTLVAELSCLERFQDMTNEHLRSTALMLLDAAPESVEDTREWIEDTWPK